MAVFIVSLTLQMKLLDYSSSTSCLDAKQGDFVPILLFFLEILKTDTPTTALIKNNV